MTFEKPLCIEIIDLASFNHDSVYTQTRDKWMSPIFTGLILGLHPANEMRRYKVTPSFIGWAASLESVLFQHCQNARKILNITSIFQVKRGRFSSAAMTLVKYECDSTNLTGTFAVILLSEKLTELYEWPASQISDAVHLYCHRPWLSVKMVWNEHPDRPFQE